MSTVQETLIPASMVPGLITIEDVVTGAKKNVYPIDAKDLIVSGEFTLVENGAVEAARMAATPLRSGYASGIPSDQIIAEIAGVEGRVVAAATPEAAAKAIEDGNSPDPNNEPAPYAPVGFEANREARATGTGGTVGTEGDFPLPEKPEEKPPPGSEGGPLADGGKSGARSGIAGRDDKKDNDKR